VEGVKDLILSEVNVKEIEYLTEESGVIKKSIKANFKTLGRRLGKNMKAAVQAINQFTEADIANLEKMGKFDLDVDGTNYELTLEDFEIKAEDVPGLLVANDGALTVALDTNLDDALLAEGMARELVNRIQNIRKNADFNVTDRIKVQLEKHEAMETAIAQFGAYIQEEVLADELTLVDGLSTGEQMELPDEVTAWVEVKLS
jgi:isoleucyl-tRNA synthetase